MNISKLQSVISDIDFDNKSAVVFDIDNTLLEQERHGEYTKYVQNVFHYLINKGVAVFIITARSHHIDIIISTIVSLQDNGLGNFKEIFFHDHIYGNNICLGKDANRSKIVNMGYDIKLAIGDNPWDMCNNAAGVFLLPNDVFFFTPNWLQTNCKQ